MSVHEHKNDNVSISQVKGNAKANTHQIQSISTPLSPISRVSLLSKHATNFRRMRCHVETLLCLYLSIFLYLSTNIRRQPRDMVHYQSVQTGHTIFTVREVVLCINPKRQRNQHLKLTTAEARATVSQLSNLIGRLEREERSRSLCRSIHRNWYLNERDHQIQIFLALPPCSHSASKCYDTIPQPHAQVSLLPLWSCGRVA